MKYINKIENFLLRKKYNSIFNKHGISGLKIGSYTINQDKSIDVEGNVIFKYENKTFPITFNVVNGNFECDNIELSSLKGSPRVVNKDFICKSNWLNTLEGGPNKVKRIFDCSVNRLTNLIGGPEEVEAYFCSYNLITSLEGAPKEVKDEFHCGNNCLSNLKYLPIARSYTIRNNPLPKEVLKLDNISLRDLAKNHDDYNIWNSKGEFNEYRWKEFKRDFHIY